MHITPTMAILVWTQHVVFMCPTVVLILIQIQIQNQYIAILHNYTCIRMLISMNALNIVIQAAFMSKRSCSCHQNVQQCNGSLNAIYHGYHMKYSRNQNISTEAKVPLGLVGSKSIAALLSCTNKQSLDGGHQYGEVIARLL